MTTDFVDVQAAAWTDIWRRFHSNGPGSTIEATTPARQWLRHIIDTYNITSMLDAPCGNGAWMKLVDLNGVHYTGIDVEPDVLAEAEANIPAGTFRNINLLTARRLPKVDLVWCRDLTIHLDLDSAVRVVNKLRNTAKYVAITSHPNADNHRELPAEGHDGRPGYWCRGLDMEAAPFNLGTRIDSVIEAQDGTHMKTIQEMVLFRL